MKPSSSAGGSKQVMPCMAKQTRRLFCGLLACAVAQDFYIDLGVLAELYRAASTLQISCLHAVRQCVLYGLESCPSMQELSKGPYVTF